jgi:hypothetical protein
MSQIFNQIRALVTSGIVQISEHGYDELANDNLTVREIVQGINGALTVEEYPAYHKGPCILAMTANGSWHSFCFC